MLEVNVKRIAYKTNNKTLIEDLNLSIPRGQILTLMGASGTGKSTLLLSILGLTPQDFISDLKVYLNQTNLSKLPTNKRKIGVVFQDNLFFPHMTLEQNLYYALGTRNLSKKAKALEMGKMIEISQLSGLNKYMPNQLSGGQAARAAVIRTLLAAPEALLLDEIFSKLDAKLRQSFRNFVFTLITQLDIPAILVTHDIKDASDTNFLIQLNKD